MGLRKRMKTLKLSYETPVKAKEFRKTDQDLTLTEITLTAERQKNFKCHVKGFD